MKFFKMFLVIFFVMFSFSCATTINYKTKVPSEIDLKSASSIFIDSIKVPNYGYIFSNDDTRAADYLENRLAYRIEDYGFYTVFTSRDRRANGDIYIDGSIEEFTIKDKKYETKYENPDYKPLKKDERRVEKRGSNINTTDRYLYKYDYDRTVKITVRFIITDNSTGKIISKKEYTYESKSSLYERERDLPSAFSIISDDLDSIAYVLAYSIHPHIVNSSVTLLESDVDDLERAEDLADDGNLQESYNIYKQYYDFTGDFVAGYNAALLQEAMGYLYQAKYEMEQLYSKSGNQKANEALGKINREIDNNIAYEKQVN